MSRPKLLLADDSVTIRKVVELTFADEGIDVTTVPDAESAMQKFVEMQPDIVLVDAGLAGTSGYHICEMIKADEATKHIPVLLLVGSFEPFDQDEAERCGADGFLTKPFHSIRDLVARVFDLLGQREETEASPEVQEEIALAAASADGDEIEHLTVEAFAGATVPETEDIENLYRNSFAQTAEIEDFDTVDDLLGDAALDDEMIEASYPTEAYTQDLAGLIPHTEVVEDSKDIDWPHVSHVSEPQPAEPAAFEPKFVLDEEAEKVASSGSETVLERVIDDGPWAEIAEPEVSEPDAAAESESAPIIEEAAETTVEPVAEAVPEPELVEMAESESVLMERSPESTVAVEEEPAPESVAEPEVNAEVSAAPAAEFEYEAGSEPSTVADLDIPGSSEVAEVPEASDGSSIAAASTEPSPEMIDLIVQRVLEKLSDRVVREVAREEVPKVAEKLIREALDNSGRRD